MNQLVQISRIKQNRYGVRCSEDGRKRYENDVWTQIFLKTGFRQLTLPVS